MKKTLSVALLLVVLAGALFAATSTRYDKYLKIFTSGEYTLKGTVYEYDENGKKSDAASPVTLAEHAGGIYIQTTVGGAVSKAIIKDGLYYMISDEEKSILTMPMEGSESEDILVSKTAPDVKSSGNGKLDNKSLFYEKYNNADDDEVTLWYEGNNLYAIQSPLSILYIQSVEQKADASLFVIPQDYTVMDLSALFADMFTMEDDSYSSDTSSSTDEEDSFDWSSLFGDWDMDFDGTERYKELGMAFGLTEKQAEDFESEMFALSYVWWSEVNEFYDEEKGKYTFTEQQFKDASDLDDDDMKNIRSLINRFRK